MNWLRTIARSLRATWTKLIEERADSSTPLKVDPQEFTRLLGSGRTQDLKTLAKLLSRRRGKV
jgi:hypothetical protein